MENMRIQECTRKSVMNCLGFFANFISPIYKRLPSRHYFYGVCVYTVRSIRLRVINYWDPHVVAAFMNSRLLNDFFCLYFHRGRFDGKSSWTRWVLWGERGESNHVTSRYRWWRPRWYRYESLYLRTYSTRSRLSLCHQETQSCGCFGFASIHSGYGWLGSRS